MARDTLSILALLAGRTQTATHDLATAAFNRAALVSEVFTRAGIAVLEMPVNAEVRPVADRSALEEVPAGVLDVPAFCLVTGRGKIAAIGRLGAAQLR